jgi:TRAP-type C4-dicarboxylate transport system permease small subunit
MEKFGRIVDGLSNVMAGLAAACLLLAILAISWMVLWRALGGVNSWELETSIYLAVAAVFLGSPYTLKTRGHIGMELLDAALPEEARRRLAVVGSLLGLAICLYLAYVGLELTVRAFVSGDRALGVWTPYLWPKYATMPLGMAVTALQYVVMLDRLRSGVPDHSTDMSDAAAAGGAE